MKERQMSKNDPTYCLRYVKLLAQHGVVEDSATPQVQVPVLQIADDKR